MPEELIEQFNKQERERYSLRLRHKVEQEKMMILYEQEIMRCYYLSSRDPTDQYIPYSFCSLIKDDEIYSQFRNNNDPISTTSPMASTNVTANNNSNSQQQPHDSQEMVQPQQQQVVELTAEEKLIKSLHTLRLKFQKLKDDLIKRQLHESDSLYAVQKMDFESTCRDLTKKNVASSSCTTSSLAVSATTAANKLGLFKQNQQHVPIVLVNKFDLFETVTFSIVAS